VIAGRPPGGTNSGGPYDDFSPVKSVKIAGGASFTLAASRTFSASDPMGTWYSYATYKDASGVWHDGPSTSFTVGSDVATDAGAPPPAQPDAGASPPPSPEAGSPPQPPPDAGAAPSYFSTLPIHATLPTEAECTAWVHAHPTPENVPANTTANQTTPSAAWLVALHENPISSCPGSQPECSDYNDVTGNFTGSTDMILRWAACKWGIDENVVRAEAQQESSWRQSEVNDSATTCHSLNVAPSALNYWSEASPCKPSKGILQAKMLYWNAWPYSLSSTALNADYRMAAQRSCMNGDLSWMKGTSGAFGAYPPSDTTTALYGCMGHWFSGSWGDSGAVNYVNNLKSILAKQGWPH
jgi:autotransporter family porin